ncbi:hypothetical protein NMY22_g18770 [Coprinellus aureogranulatus]|nr:hypothetical protein NMY22_g18770 [Coprinellus aureogranulatus]
MFNEASDFYVAEARQINANTYHEALQRSSYTVVRRGGRLSNSVQINAENIYLGRKSDLGSACEAPGWHRDRRGDTDTSIELEHQGRTGSALKGEIPHLIVGVRVQLIAALCIVALYCRTASAAFHDARQRGDAPKCHPQTRAAVQEDIFSWISSKNCGLQRHNILWLTGPAGAGKTAIMGSMADKCEGAGLLAASFFFSAVSKSPHVQSKSRFITTLAYQVIQLPGLGRSFRRRVLSTVANNPAIFEKSLNAQMEALILKPLRDRKFARMSEDFTMAILIDGVDECEAEEEHHATKESPKARSKEDDQSEVLSALVQAAQDPAFPFRIVIASRPEPQIRRFFATHWHNAAKELFLDESYSPSADIELFLHSKFSHLRRKHPHLSPAWPGKAKIANLIGNASGQFIYAATVMAFIDSHSGTPDTNLEYILNGADINNPSPLSILDSLYDSILRAGASYLVTRQWLEVLRCVRAPTLVSLIIVDGEKEKERHVYQPVHDASETYLPAWVINLLMESVPREAEIALGHLPSLLKDSRPA